ncbi:MAG: hypothetical protein ACLUOI_27435 [Eisenbergiella sp.]
MNQFDGVYGAMVFNLIGTVDLIGEYLFCIEGDHTAAFYRQNSLTDFSNGYNTGAAFCAFSAEGYVCRSKIFFRHKIGDAHGCHC